MRIAYGITLLLATSGVLYNSFSLAALLAFAFIAISSAPLLLFSFGLGDTSAPKHGAAEQSSLPLPMVFLCLSILNVLVLIDRHGFRLADVLSSEGLVAIAREATLERYNLGSTQGNALLVSAAIANAFLWARASVSKILAMFVALVPAGLYALVSTEKWPLYCATSFFVAGLLLSERKRGTYRHALIAAACVVAIGVASLAVRQGVTEYDATFDALATLLALLGHYVFAQYETFGRWLMGGFADCCSLGLYTFSGPVAFLDLAERIPGVFSEIETVRGLETNIYTAWRYIVQDFSIFGPVVLISLFALTYRYCWVTGHYRITRGLLTLLFISTFLQINTTIFVHNSVALAALFCAFVATLSMKRHNESP